VQITRGATSVVFLHPGATHDARFCACVPTHGSYWELEPRRGGGSLTGLWLSGKAMGNGCLAPICADCWGNLKTKRTTSPALKMHTNNSYSEITKSSGLFNTSSVERQTMIFKMQAFRECVFW